MGRRLARACLFIALILVGLSLASPEAAPSEAQSPAAPRAADGQASPPAPDAPSASNRLTHKGVVVDFEAWPVGGRPGQALMVGQLADVRFRLTEEASGKPIRGTSPGAWMDMGQVLQGHADAIQKSCKDKISLYLGGAVGIRPMIDLNSYYVLVLNREPSISVVDPLVSMVGMTSTLGTIPLKGAGADWVKSADRKRLYVSMPQAGEVAIVDAEAFKVLASVTAGEIPTRVALQPDGRYLWVGNNGRAAARSGVTVIDVETLKPVAQLATGAGHHEIAFSEDSRHAFVSNRDAGTVTVIDVQAKRKVKDVATGPMPIALAYSPLAKALYVADGKAGTIAVVDGRGFAVATRIAAKPGLGPLRFTPDGRYGLVVNPAEDAVYVLDAADSTLAHTIPVPGRPYQVVLSRAFAYVRSLDSERVSMINLSSVGPGKQPIVQSFAAGAVAPKLAGDLPLADSVASTANEAMMLVVNPADSTTYVYMEGMNAPSSNYKVRGAQARAVTVIDRSLQEVEPGVYASKVKITAPGRYDVAFLLENPQILHCFAVEVKPNPLIKQTLAALAVEYMDGQRTVKADGNVPLRFKLREPATGTARTGLADVRVLYFRAPGHDRTEVRAEEAGDGVYQAMLPITRPGAYYVYVAVPSERVGYADLQFFTMMATTGATAPPKANPSPKASPSPEAKPPAGTGN
ncbi:MAG TPA: YncE family protein [Candidatus Methylomirabilis sp.]|nr:YncE family protein [Candidatus Methylomirabilis sp.]